VQGDQVENKAQLDKIKVVQVTHHQNRHGRRKAEKAATAIVQSNSRGYRDATVPRIKATAMIVVKCDPKENEMAPFLVGKLLEDTRLGTSRMAVGRYARAELHTHIHVCPLQRTRGGSTRTRSKTTCG
jgi:hypothetical protein